ncbi:MAG: response regulator [Myxococcales bacterium]|nr:MAG: response regulator [Myxococcales bacterium]
MRAWLLSFVQTPAFEDDDDRRAAQLLRLVLGVCIASIVGYALATVDHSIAWSKRAPLFGALLVTLLCERGLRRGYVRPQAWTIVVGLTALSLGSQVTSGGLRAPATLTLFVAVVLAGQLLGYGGALIVAGIGSVGTLVVFELYRAGHVVRPLLHTEGQYARALVVQLLGTGGLMAITAWSLSATMRRLRREQAAFRDLVEEAPDAMASLDAEGRLIQVNRAHEKLVGQRREELLGAPFDHNPSALDDQTMAAARERYAELKSGKHIPLFRFELARPDGTKVHAETNARAVKRADGTDGVDLVIRDVSEQVLAERRQQDLEEQLRAARKLEAIGQLAGGVAHDFNNLLTVVLGNIQLMRLSELSEEQDESLGSIEAAADRAATITRQLLAIGRRQPSRPLALSLNDSVRQISGLLRRLVPEHVIVTTALDAALPNIVADPAQVDQVLLNLVANARDAMPDGGELRIETSTTTLSHDEQLPPLERGVYVTLRVKDSGHGMSSETQQRVFEPFFTTKSLTAGTGLGLATVYGIVKQHGGHIVVESAPGAGSSFSVYLPATGEATSGLEPVAPPAPRRCVRLLLVDDDVGVRSVVATVLQRAGHQVTVAPNAHEALAAFERMTQPLELLVTDVVMPGMSGVELSRELRQRAPALKVLLFSGYPGRDVLALGEQGAAYLAKPVTPKQLLERIDQLLGST